MGRRLRIVAFVMTGVLFAVTGAAAAWGDAAQGGRHSGSNQNPDGTSANISGATFQAAATHCVIFAVLAWDAADQRQLETGLVRCNGKTLDGTCQNVRFVETYTPGGGYNCFPHGSFSNNTYSSFKVQRDNNASNQFHAYVDGLQHEALAQYNGGQVQIWAWGEHTGTYSCSGWQGYGHIAGWSKIDLPGSYVPLSGVVDTLCWGVTSINGSGDFDVFH